MITGRVALLISVFLASVRCAPTSAVTADVLIADGCVVMITGMSVHQAQEVVRKWNIEDDCKVQIRGGTSDGTE